ncbi:MAG: flagellar protein FliS [Vicinamibacterales bacterium]
MYQYANMRLLDAAMHNDVAPIDEVRRILEILREGWATIAANTGTPVGAAR